MQQPTPTKIKLLQKEKVLEVTFDDGEFFRLPCEYLRVFSPSAEVRGHGLAEPKLVMGKQDVNIVSIEPVGNYAVRLVFDDGHNTGLYSWVVLYELGKKQQENWQRYQTRLQESTHNP